ncbi:MAG TPA: tRNA pseudouridine(38-40) synthase TruA [Tepidisphaeraceae bacterium]|jgi:tRNA pseudouridine38-40 synthase|nr:tRNA pseudouridine(38-40) synthase TruA [Tepidisphaeraceae bacterium]
MPQQRYKLTIAYRGTHYHGWQWQAANEFYKGPPVAEGHGIPTIQETVERAVIEVVRHPIRLVGSSRTDSGVHAKGQVAHFDTDQTQIPPEGLKRAINAALPDDIVIRDVEPVPDSFDAISSTISKHYQYLIWNAEERPPFFCDLAWYRWQPLDIVPMAEAGAQFIGERDFASFARPGHLRENTIRKVTACDVSRRREMVVIGIEGGGFLWNQIRVMVGTLVEIGMGKYPPSRVAQMMAALDRRAAGPTAPPQGLYLQWIKYGK